jgi:RimJ/RimL family protein N-acetyltransferase
VASRAVAAFAASVDYSAAMSNETYLRPVAAADLEILDVLYNGGPEAASEYGWFGWSDPAGLRRRWEDNGLLGSDSGNLIVASGLEVAGHVSWHRNQQGPLNHSWNIGIGLLADARGRGIGTRAQALLVRYLFTHTMVNRVDANTDVTNIAEQRSLEKAGFTRDGVLRGAQFRDGGYHDMVVYSVLRHEVIPG